MPRMCLAPQEKLTVWPIGICFLHYSCSIFINSGVTINISLKSVFYILSSQRDATYLRRNPQNQLSYTLNWLNWCLPGWLIKFLNIGQVPEGFLLMHLRVARFQRPRAYEAHWLTERTIEADITEVREAVCCCADWQHIHKVVKNHNDNKLKLVSKIFESLLVIAD